MLVAQEKEKLWRINNVDNYNNVWKNKIQI